MIIFAGIHEVTKELDDMSVYSFKDKTWNHIFKDPIAQKKNPMIDPNDHSFK